MGVRRILVRAGLPAGVLNLVMGKGSVVGQAMLDSPDINAITFTGSVGTGQRVAAASVKHMRKFQLEMGGKNPLVVVDDADLKNAVECAANGAYFSTGQRCTASSRLVVTAGIHDKFVAALTERLQGLKVDNALKEGAQIGPVVDQSQLDQDESYIDIAKKEGATLHWGGERLNRETPGFYLQPALFTETAPEMRINREEVFGPVASVIKVKDYDEGLAVANDTPIRPHLRHLHDEPKTRVAFQAEFRSRHGDGQPADGRCRLSRSLRWPERLELRPARTGTLRRRVLHDGQDGLYVALKRRPPASIAECPRPSAVAEIALRDAPARPRPRDGGVLPSLRRQCRQ